jgi:hypothetical protein
MENYEALLHAHPNGTVSVDMDKPLAPGDYTVELTAIKAVEKPVLPKRSILDDWPIHHVPWHDGIAVSRDDMYD